MKIYKILIVLFFISSSSHCQILKVSLRDYNLHGKVMKVQRKVFRDIELDSLVNDKILHNTFNTNFNRSGLTTTIDNSLDLKKLKITGECKYDERNRVVLLKTKWSQKLFDNQRNLIKRIFLGNRLITKKFVFEDIVVYNAGGDMAILDKVEDDLLVKRKVFRLNTSNKVTETTLVSPKDNKDKISEEVYTYNDRGFVTEKVGFHFFTKQRVSKKYKYDDHGNVIEEWVSLPRGDFMKTRKKYNKYNDLVEEVADYNGRMTINRTTYTYDKHNNFIRKEEVTNDFKKIVTIRDITYYD